MNNGHIDWLGIITPRVSELLDSYSYRPTLRQVYYRLVSELLIPNTITSYKTLSDRLARAREQRIIDPTSFEDRARSSDGGDSGYTDPDRYLQSQLDSVKYADLTYERSRWAEQPCHVIVWLEKDALFTPILEIANRYSVRVYAARGFSSFTAVYGVAQFIQHMDKSVRVVQLTDFDPSGEDMVRDLNERLTRYGATNFDVVKVALNVDQVKQYNLPTAPAKKTDSRFNAFAAKYGSEVVELDALPPDVLETIVSNAINAVIDDQAWNESAAQEELDRAKIKSKVDKIMNLIKEDNNG